MGLLRTKVSYYTAAWLAASLGILLPPLFSPRRLLLEATIAEGFSIWWRALPLRAANLLMPIFDEILAIKEPICHFDFARGADFARRRVLRMLDYSRFIDIAFESFRGISRAKQSAAIYVWGDDFIGDEDYAIMPRKQPRLYRH